MCNKCLLMHTEIGEDIDPTVTITMCKDCGKCPLWFPLIYRILTATKHWVRVERESIEELGVMLKMIKGLKKVGFLCSILLLRTTSLKRASSGPSRTAAASSSSWISGKRSRTASP